MIWRRILKQATERGHGSPMNCSPRTQTTWSIIPMTPTQN